MSASIAPQSSRRCAVRRAVRVECAVTSDLWDESVPLLATNLSPFGLWIDAGLALDVGEEVLVRFSPPGWPSWGWPVTALARVERVSLARRRNDHPVAGMGLSFIDLDAEERDRMAAALRGMPPPFPRPRPADDAVLIVDGIRFELCAEGELLGGGRPRVELPRPVAARSPLHAKHRARARALRPQRIRTPIAARRRPPALRLVS
ncbi:MAG: hypothetical protein ACHQ53_07680 [Polyangiales bacterium]